MLGDWARAQKARKHKRPEAFTFSNIDQASQLPHCFSNPHLSCWQAPWGTYKPVSHPWVPGLARGHPALTLLQVGGKPVALGSYVGRTARGRGRDETTSSKRPWGSPEGWSPHCSGVRTWSGFKYLPMVRICYLTTDPAANISKMWGKLKS